MFWLALLLGFIVVVLVHHFFKFIEKRMAGYSEMVTSLQADNRALTESLCRANGTPYIPSVSVRMPSEGWFDAVDSVVPPKKTD